MNIYILISVLALGCYGQAQERRFPDDFMFGAATAAYQIEGAWNADDKGENIWDYMTHTNPTVIADLTNGDVAANSYDNYKRDVEMMRELGLDAYRFSISWSRILPTGYSNRVSAAGVAYYNNLINEMLKYNITPMATLYHWDLPQKLQELGGFANPLIADWFEDYARVVFENFGDRVKYWITFNEPNEICYGGYGSTIFAPILNRPGLGDYLCAKHLVVAHARAYHAYNNDFKPRQNGVCGITISIGWHMPRTDAAEDVMAAELMGQSVWGIYAHPIFSKEGGFPKELSKQVADQSAQEGYRRSRLPEFTEEEKAFVRGTQDFFGVNHYGNSYVYATENGPENWTPDDWLQSASSWLKLAPESIYYTLTNLSKRYDNPVFYITENGWSTESNGGLIDESRILYYRSAWDSVLNTLDAGVDLRGYMAWSLMDNFEWMQGYTQRFGLYEIDFQDPARPRIPRKSAFVYKQLIKTRAMDPEYEPDTMTMTIDEGH